MIVPTIKQKAFALRDAWPNKKIKYEILKKGK